MMRRLFYIAFFILIAQTGLGQKLDLQLDRINPIIKNDQHGDSIRKYLAQSFYAFPKTDTSLKINKTNTRHLQMTALYSNKVAIHYFFAADKIPQLTDYTNDHTRTTMYMMNGYMSKYAIPILDSDGIIITVNGINHQNVDQYQFRILENKTRVVLPWTKPHLFTKPQWYTKIADSTKIDMEVAYLGQFKDAFGKALTFQVRRIDQPDIIQVQMSALWVKRAPKVVGVFTINQLADFLKIVKNQWSSIATPSAKDWTKDSTLLKRRTNFSATENNLIFYMDDLISHKEDLEYELLNNGNSTGWLKNDFDLNFIWLKDLRPDKYKLRIRYSIQRPNVTEYDFTITPAWYQTAWAKLASVLLGAFALGFVILLIRSSRQSKKIAAQSIQKQIVQTELKAIRSQFNPHFVFNALNSIQGLITKNDPDNASRYLVEFGTLMRDALKASSREFTNLAGEIKILENYVRLEQLRFGFGYEFKVDKHLAVNDIEVPSLILQPIVENAIKHGISPLQEAGRLLVTFEKAGADMVVTVIDNGAGFKEQNPINGFGLQLTRDRIKFLNQTMDGQEITLNIERANDETHVIICFKNLLI